jgi:hypothetical protein
MHPCSYSLLVFVVFLPSLTRDGARSPMDKDTGANARLPRHHTSYPIDWRRRLGGTGGGREGPATHDIE